MQAVAEDLAAKLQHITMPNASNRQHDSSHQHLQISRSGAGALTTRDDAVMGQEGAQEAAEEEFHAMQAGTQQRISSLLQSRPREAQSEAVCP
jgi:hypothetical protein